MSLNLFLIVVSLVGLTYLIYRYARYSNWRSTIIGQSFMLMKAALWSLLSFVVIYRLVPDLPGKELAALILLGFMTGAIYLQTLVVIRLQGGYKRARGKTSGLESQMDAERL